MTQCSKDVEIPTELHPVKSSYTINSSYFYICLVVFGFLFGWILCLLIYEIAVFPSFETMNDSLE